MYNTIYLIVCSTLFEYKYLENDHECALCNGQLQKTFVLSFFNHTSSADLFSGHYICVIAPNDSRLRGKLLTTIIFYLYFILFIFIINFLLLSKNIPQLNVTSINLKVFSTISSSTK